MLKKPDIPDQLIAACARSEYGLDVASVTFLPLGYDVHTVVYRIMDRSGAAYFLKLRMGDFNPLAVALPKFLNSQGIHTILAPIQTQNGQLFARFRNDAVMLYPFIPGKDGYQVRLVDLDWIELGWTLKRVHSASLPQSLDGLIPREAYDAQWRECVKQFQAQVAKLNYKDSVAKRLAAFMKTKQQAISHMVERAEELANLLSQQSLELVLCHSDAHPGNYLVADNGELYLVDWDNPIYAPRERDLMFFGSGMSGDQPGGLEQRSFYQGYGQVEVNLHALAYYRYERIIQDIAEFCNQLLLTTKGGKDRRQAYKYFTSQFLHGQVVEVAFETDRLADEAGYRSSWN